MCIIIKDFWQGYLNTNLNSASGIIPPSFHFCDNEKDANDCSQLVLMGVKQATATSLWWYRKHKQSLPSAGDKYIITDWDMIPTSIIEVTKVEMIPFIRVTSEFAAAEGEGDLSLRHWREVHKDFYNREMTPFGNQFDEKMIIVCEYFKKIYPIT